MQYKVRPLKSEVTVEGIANVHYFEFTDRYHTEGNAHGFRELLYVDKGAVVVDAENYKGTLSCNQLIIHKPNEKHALTCESAVAPNVIIIGFQCDAPELELFSREPYSLTLEQKRMLSEVMQEGTVLFAPPYDIPNTAEMYIRENLPFGAEQMLKMKLESFLISLVRNASLSHSEKEEVKSTIPIAEIKQYIDEHYSEKLALDNLCFIFSTNKTTLCRNFKTEYGQTVLDYINRLKIKEAKSMLRKKQHSETEIAERLGFNSIHYFCRFFKKYAGQSPRDYMKSVRSKLDL